MRACSPSAFAVLVVLGCGSPAERASPPALPEQVARAAALRAPVFTFSAPSAWHSRRGDAAVDPPDLARETWRVLVNQNQPIQAKTPHWQALPARETVELQMPPRTAFRCLVAPLDIATRANALGTELKAWLLARRVLCSSDGFRTFTESIHRVRVPIGAPREVGDDAGLLLREQDDAGRVRHTFVLLRSEPEPRAATTGPPRVIDGLAMDDD
jgi:hypothetical protein